MVNKVRRVNSNNVYSETDTIVDENDTIWDGVSGFWYPVTYKKILPDVAATGDRLVANKKSDLSFGMNISNIGNKISYTESIQRDFIPINLRLGTDLTTKMDDYNKISLSFDLNKLSFPDLMLTGLTPSLISICIPYTNANAIPSKVDLITNESS